MNISVLPGAVVSPEQIRRVSHPLAAANHRQWILWERWVLRDPKLLTAGDTTAIIERILHPGLFCIWLYKSRTSR